MAHLVYGDNEYPASFTVPDDGDEGYAASVNGAFDALADRTAWANDRLANGVKRIRFVWTTAALKALDATTGDVCVLLGASDIPAGIYVYSVGPFAMGYSVDDAPWQYASTAVSGAMWFNALYWQIGGATDSIATVGSDGRLTAKGPNAIRSIAGISQQLGEVVISTDGDKPIPDVITVSAAASDIVFADSLVNIGGPGSGGGAKVTVRLAWSTNGTTWTNFALAKADVNATTDASVSIQGSFTVDPAFVGSASVRVRMTVATTNDVSPVMNGMRVQVVQP